MAKAPRQVADGGYASPAKPKPGANATWPYKKSGLSIEDMVGSRWVGWVYRKLRNFRAGIEAGISCLKSVYG